MSSINHLLMLAEAYGAGRSLSASRVSTLVFNDGKVIDRLAAGADITVGRLERAMQWFSDNWPDDLAWPDGIARPARKPAIAAAE